MGYAPPQASHCFNTAHTYIMTFKPHHNVLDDGHKAILYLNLIYTILKNASVLYIGGSAVLPSAFSKLYYFILALQSEGLIPHRQLVLAFIPASYKQSYAPCTSWSLASFSE